MAKIPHIVFLNKLVQFLFFIPFKGYKQLIHFKSSYEIITRSGKEEEFVSMLLQKE